MSLMSLCKNNTFQGNRVYVDFNENSCRGRRKDRVLDGGIPWCSSILQKNGLKYLSHLTRTKRETPQSPYNDPSDEQLDTPSNR